MITAGVDIGSITAKAAVIVDGEVKGTRVDFTGYNAEQAGRRVLDELMKELGMDGRSIDRVVSTGYGRNSVKFADKAITEIICHGTGAHFLNPDVRSIIDVGGQDSKAMVVDSTSVPLGRAGSLRSWHVPSRLTLTISGQNR